MFFFLYLTFHYCQKVQYIVFCEPNTQVYDFFHGILLLFIFCLVCILFISTMIEIFQRQSHCNFQEHRIISLQTNFQQFLISTSEDIPIYLSGQEIISPDFRHSSNLNNLTPIDFQDMVLISFLLHFCFSINWFN